jgi:streptogramin lyase
MQDSHGQWLLSVYCAGCGELLMLASDDLTHWRLHSLRQSEAVGAVALGQDASDRYYLVAVNASGNPQIYFGNDAKTWEISGVLWKRYANPHTISTYPLTLFKQSDGGMVLLFSDIYTGLQYAALKPLAAVAPDLVTQTGLEPYAAAVTRDGVIAALWKDDDISIERFHKFALPENGVNPSDQIIYTERSHDRQGGSWERIIARERFRVPDVTAVGTSPEGRAWWGMETGIMSLKGSDFFFSDVSLGFFNHDIDHIVHCGTTIWFVATNLDTPQVGISEGNRPDEQNVGKPLRFNEIQGGISAAACGGKGETYFATRKGEVLLSPADDPRRAYSLPKEDAGNAISALAFDNQKSRLLAGTTSGAFYAMNTDGRFTLVTRFKHPVQALAVDKDGHIWVAVRGDGVTVLDAAGHNVKMFGAPAIPARIKKIATDPKGGVWAIADSDYAAGMMHLDLRGMHTVSPPQETLRDIVDFALSDDGSLWIGTNLKGIYHYKEAR